MRRNTAIELTLEAGAPDNVTVIVVEIVEQTPDDVSTAAVDVVPAPVTTAATTPRPLHLRPRPRQLWCREVSRRPRKRTTQATPPLPCLPYPLPRAAPLPHLAPDPGRGQGRG